MKSLQNSASITSKINDGEFCLQGIAAIVNANRTMISIAQKHVQFYKVLPRRGEFERVEDEINANTFRSESSAKWHHGHAFICVH